MTREALERAKCCIACIESAEKNIQSFERICEAGKGEIVICTKERLDGGHGNVQPMYITGEILQAFKTAYTEHWQAFADKHQNELDKL